jgi:hypothetical protein
MKLRLTALALPVILACSAATFAAPVTVVQTGVSFQQALDIIQRAGYQNIHKIELDHNYYVVDAQDANGKAILFKIDSMSGKISPMTAKHVKHRHHHAKHAHHAAKANQ